MSYGLTYSSSIFDIFGVLSSFNVAESIWDKYEKYATPKIEEATLKLRGSLFYIKDVTPEEARKELKTLNTIVPILHNYRETLLSIDDKEFERFKNTTLLFFDTIDLLQDNLEDIAQENTSYSISTAILSNDWDSEEDKRWDNY